MSEIDIVGLAVDGLKRSIAADEAADTIATLTAERDDALGGYKAQVRRADEWRAHAEAAEARAARLEEALREALYEVAWSQYHEGIERNGRWMNGAMSDAEALERDAGFEEGVWHDAIKLQGAIDRVVEKRLAALAQETQG